MSGQPWQHGGRLLTDGTTRPVFADADARQYVEDDAERVYGTWLPPGDVPLVVEGLPRC
jgi:hypothetical protein